MSYKGCLSGELQEQLRKLGVAIIYLYGSEAMQVAGVLSDIDIGVVLRVPGQALKERRERYRLHTRLTDLLEAVFSVACARELDLVFLQTASPILQFEAINARYPLFVADSTFQADYEASVTQAYLDSRPLVEVHFQAALSRAA